MRQFLFDLTMGLVVLFLLITLFILILLGRNLFSMQTLMSTNTPHAVLPSNTPQAVLIMPTSSLMPAQMTATSLVATFYATQTIGAGGIPQQPPILFMPPTQTLVPTRTPSPTLTQREATEQIEATTDSLDTAFGFSHPVFQEIAKDFVGGERAVFGDMSIEIEKTQFEGSTYAVGIIDFGLYSRHILFFRVDNEDVVLLADMSVGDHAGYSVQGDPSTPGFADRNQNGLPDIALSGFSGGSHITVGMALMEITEEGELVNVAAATTWYHDISFVDIDGDQIPEIVGYRREGYGSGAGLSRCCSSTTSLCELGYFQLFGWNGTAYVDVSAEHPDFYLPAIVYTHMNGCDNIGSVCQALVNYYTMGQLEEGWQSLQDTCSPTMAPEMQATIEAWIQSLEE